MQDSKCLVSMVCLGGGEVCLGWPGTAAGKDAPVGWSGWGQDHVGWSGWGGKGHQQDRILSGLGSWGGNAQQREDCDPACITHEKLLNLIGNKARSANRVARTLPVVASHVQLSVTTMCCHVAPLTQALLGAVRSCCPAASSTCTCHTPCKRTRARRSGTRRSRCCPSRSLSFGRTSDDNADDER